MNVVLAVLAILCTYYIRWCRVLKYGQKIRYIPCGSLCEKSEMINVTLLIEFASSPILSLKSLMLVKLVEKT